MPPSMALALLLAAAPGDGPLTWQTSWTAAAAAAKAQGKRTVAVDVWATWCHTCLSMKHYVLTDPGFEKVADQHVWLALDYDLESNAAFFRRHPVDVFPTFLVLDVETEAVLARWAGSGSVDDMVRFFAHARAGDGPLAQGQRALARGAHGEAKQIFARALEAGVKPAADRKRVLLGWLEALYQSDKPACALEGSARLPETDRSSQGADFAALVAYCATSLKDPAQQRAVFERVVARLAPLARDASAPLEVDDRSSVWGILEMAHDALGDKAKADADAKARLTLLEAAAKAAPDPHARATFDYHRMQAYLRLGRPDEARRMLEASEKAEPTDFNHPWRLAKVYLHTKDYAASLAAIDRALSRGYGGRKLRLYSTRIDVLLAAGRLDEAKQTVARARKDAERLDPAQIRPFWQKEFDGRAAKVAQSKP